MHSIAPYPSKCNVSTKNKNPSVCFSDESLRFTYKFFKKIRYLALLQVLLAYLHCLSAVFATSLPFSS